MYKPRFTAIYAALAGAMLLGAPSHAHHGSNGQFDLSETIVVSGVVTKIKFVNPHSYIYFNVADAGGEVNEWRCELRSAGIHRRYGWTEDMFAEGTEISITGAPARREEFGCFTQTITFSNGRVLDRQSKIGDDGAAIDATREAVLPDGTPNILGTWVAPERSVNGAPPPRRTGTVGGDGYKLTEAGSNAIEGFQEADNPRLQCKPVNIFQDWTSDQHVNKVTRAGNTIVINYGFMDLARTVHMDAEGQQAEAELSRAGYSLGYWEDGVLVVETTRFEAGFLTTGRAGPMKHSNQMSSVERFSLSEDGKTLTRTYEIEDPLYLDGIFVGEDKLVLTTSPYEIYECLDLTEEVVKGF